MMKNRWTFAVGEFNRLDGWLLVRFTRRSSAQPSKLLWWLGTVLAVVGVVLANFGAWLRTGRWLHVYRASSVKRPYRSYEPLNGGPKVKRPPFRFQGRVVERHDLS